MVLFQFLYFCQSDLQTLVRFSDWRLGFCSKFRSFGFLLIGNFFFNRYDFLHLLSLGFIHSEFGHELIGLYGGFFELWLHLCEFDLHFFDGIVGLEQLIETVLKSWDRETGLFTLIPEDSFVSIQKFKINGGCDMVDSAQFCLERDGLLFDAFVDGLEDLHKDIQLPFKSQLNFDLSQLTLTDTNQGFFRPFREPVNRTSVDQRWEHS